jgi:hypothetical protein
MPRPSRQHASVILMVLVSITFASAALLAFIDRASEDLIAPVHAATANRLRPDAYSAMETVLATLGEFRAANGGNLRSPAEGWDWQTMLDEEWVSFAPAGDRTVTVTFEDESAKLSLPAITDQNLLNYFLYYGLSNDEASYLRDTLRTWVGTGTGTAARTSFVPTSSGAYTPAQYQQEELPFSPPLRSLRSWAELAAIEGLRATGDDDDATAFYDLNGNLTPLGRRFISAFSLYNFTAPNINGGKPDTLAVLAGLDVQQQQAVLDFLGKKGFGNATVKDLGYFTQVGDLGTVANTLANPTGVGVNVTALRINVTVKEGLAVFTLSVLVTWPNGATAVPAPTPPAQATTANTNNQITTAVPQTAQLNYPCTILELRESDLDPAETAAQDTTLNTPLLSPPAS